MYKFVIIASDRLIILYYKILLYNFDNYMDNNSQPSFTISKIKYFTTLFYNTTTYHNHIS